MNLALEENCFKLRTINLLRRRIAKRSNAIPSVFSADFGSKSYRNLVSCFKKTGCCHLLQILGNIGERGLLVVRIINDTSRYWRIFALHTFLLRYAQQDDSLPMILVIDPGDNLDQPRQTATILWSAPFKTSPGSSSPASLLPYFVLVILITHASEPALWKLYISIVF